MEIVVVFWYSYWVIKLGSQSCSYTPRKKTRISSNFQKIVTSCILFITVSSCLLYTSDAADDMQCVDLGGRRIIKKLLEGCGGVDAVRH